MSYYFTVETSLDETESRFSKDYCPIVEIEYEATLSSDNEVEAIRLISVLEIPPKELGDTVAEFISLDRITEQDMKWIMRKCLQDAEERDYEQMHEEAKADRQIDYAKEG